jgi:hypothetical protein
VDTDEQRREYQLVTLVFFIFIVSNISEPCTYWRLASLLGFLRGFLFGGHRALLAGMVGWDDNTISTFYFSISGIIGGSSPMTDDLSDEPYNPSWKVMDCLILGFLLMILIASLLKALIISGKFL